MEISEQGSVRVDLLGGTLDLDPINHILRNTVTLNIATSLKAKVSIKSLKEDDIIIHSKDYASTNKFKKSDLTVANFESDFFGPLSFISQLVNLFEFQGGLEINLESGSPPGAGLGGSSSMGVTFYKAMANFCSMEYDRLQAIKSVKNVESIILNKGPTGYQDYYPALFGGVLALFPGVSEVRVEQLFEPEFKEFLEDNLTLVYSGKLRFSAINNWEVYKDFFDGRNGVFEGLKEIANLSSTAYQAIKEKKYDVFLECLIKEGQIREGLFKNIVTEDIRSFYNDLGNLAKGMKMCGAGGGGCFIIAHDKENRGKIIEKIQASEMRHLEFSVESPI